MGYGTRKDVGKGIPGEGNSESKSLEVRPWGLVDGSRQEMR